MLVCKFVINTKGKKIKNKKKKKDYFLSSVTVFLDHYLKSYEDFVIMGDFNANESNPAMETFLNQHKCKNIIREKHVMSRRRVLV